MAGAVIENLSPKDRKALALFYDTDTYAALKKLLEAERLNTATKLIDVAANDVVSIARHQGRADALKQLHITLKNNHKAYDKKS